jgi:glutamine synthetase
LIDYLHKRDLYPNFGVELEFYLDKELSSLHQQKFIDYLNNNGLLIQKIEEERGKYQYEIQLLPQKSVEKFILDIEKARILLQNIANKYNYNISFASKPFANMAGSSMHIHISLLDVNEINLLQKIGEDESVYMQKMLSGLLHTMKDTLSEFIYDENDYARFVAGFDAPINISWGGNNRTTALRIPTNDKNRRIEHRIPSANCNPKRAINAIIKGIIYGLENDKLILPPRIYGNAHDKQYDLTNLY